MDLYRKEKSSKLNVCVIGAGAAGLSALRHFTSKPDCFNVTAFELHDRIGGTWTYTDQVGFNQYGIRIHSSMYKNLRTNLPMETMEFPDFPSNCPVSYVDHEKVLEYLNDYAKHFDLFRYIKFHHQVTNIMREKENDFWIVTVNDVIHKKQFTEKYDVLLVCVGRYSFPNMPDYDTLKLFQGTVLHSHDYRVPEPFAGQRVAVIGGGLSGIDVCLELSPIVEHIVFINRFDSNYHFRNLPGNIQQVAYEVTGFDHNSMSCIDRSTGEIHKFQINSVIFTTGYVFNIDFIDQKSCNVSQNEDGTFNDLYRHFINIWQPTMAILAVMQRILPFIMYDYQVRFFMKVILGEVSLPTKEEMLNDAKEDIRKRLEKGHNPKDRHLMNRDLIEEHLDSLSKDGNLKPLRKVILKLFSDLISVRMENIVGYKRLNYKFISDDDYEVFEES